MTQQQRRLTMLVPALATPLNSAEPLPAETAPPLDALRMLLSRSSVRELPLSGMEAQLFQLFAARISDPDGELPVAAVTHAFDRREVVSGWRMRCDPVHLVPGHNSLVLAGSDELEITPEESDILVAELNEFYSDKGWRFEATDPARWYLTLPQAPRLKTHPLPEVMGRSIDRYLPRGADAAVWHTVLAEVQMFLHSSGINLQRESCGKPTINSLWFWGGGTLPVVESSPWDRVWSNEVVGRALAGIADTPCSPVPESGQQWLREATGGTHLVILDRGRYIPRFEERFTWLELLQQFDKQWFSPLLMALKKGKLGRLEIYAGSNRLFQLTPRSLWRLWRRRPDIAALLGTDE